jgi:hypothetical protein
MCGAVYCIAIRVNRCRPIKIIAATRAIDKGIVDPGMAMRAIVMKRTVTIITGLDPNNIMGAASITWKCMLHFSLLNMELFYITPLSL